MYRTALLAIILAITGCSATPKSRVAAEAPAYDLRTPEAFSAFVRRHGKHFPVPTELGMFERPDGELRYAHWATWGGAPRAGTAVFFQGRTEFIEKNLYAYERLLARGYDVWTLDWRGQGLSSRGIAGEPDKGYIDDYESYVRDAEAFLAEKVKLKERSGRKILLAHSMGGAIGALYLLRNPQAFNAAVFTSPLLGLPEDVDNWYVRAGNWVKTNAGFGEACAAGRDCRWISDFPADRDPCTLTTAEKARAALRDASVAYLYSHDAAKLAEIDCWIRATRGGTGSTLGLASPTSRWLRATLEATDRMQERKAALQTPLLIVGAGNETIVRNEALKTFCEGSPNCCRLELEGAGHEILIEEQALADRFWQWFDQFTARGDAPAVCRAE